jgi:hypothetical protein
MALCAAVERLDKDKEGGEGWWYEGQGEWG